MYISIWDIDKIGYFLTKHLPYQRIHQHHSVKILFFLNKFIYLFIYFWLRWVFVAAHGLSLAVVSGGYSLLWCVGFSLRWFLLWQSTGSRHMGFSSCGTLA